MAKFLAFSSFADRAIGMKEFFQLFEETRTSNNAPLVDGEEYIFQTEPEEALRSQLEQDGKTVSVNPRRIASYMKKRYLEHHTQKLWQYYLIENNPYFLYDIVCLYNYAEVDPPRNIVEESYKIFMQLADIAIASKNKQKDALELLALKSTSKGTNKLFKQYEDFLTDLVIYDIVEEIKLKENPSSVKYLYGKTAEIIDQTVTSSPIEIGSIKAISSSIPEIKRSYKRMEEFKKREQQWLKVDTEM